MLAIEQVLKVAAYEADVLKVREVGGNNRGPRVEEYEQTVSINPGDPWCAAFVFWCLKKADVDMLIFADLVNPSWVPNIEGWAIKHGVLSRTPSRGSFMLLYDSGGPFHIGFVTQALADGYVSTIEGNTSSGPTGSQGDGGGVFRRARLITDCRFVNWGSLVKEPLRVMVQHAASSSAVDVPCHPKVEFSTTRVDLRPIADALGYKITVTPTMILLENKI